MNNLLRSGLFIIILLISGCGWDGTPTRNNDFTPLTSIEIVAESPTIAAHTSTKLSVKGNYSGLYTRDITDQVAWSSDAPTIAGFVTPAMPNRVTGQAPGTAILTADVGDVSSTFTLTVSSAAVTSLTITPADPSIVKGSTSQFTASGTFSDSTTQDLTFDAGWVSTAPGVATVSDDPGSKGLAQALAVGAATITATFDGVSGSTLLTVTTAALQSIAVSPVNPTIVSISRVRFTAIGRYSDGSTADITSLAAWSSSRTDIASISTGGAAKTLAQGTTSINASLAGVSGTSSVKVTGGNLTGIALSPTNPRLVKDTTGRMTAIGTFSNGSSRDITGAVDWSVAIPANATVTTPGGNQAWLNPLKVTSGTMVTAKSGLVSADTTLTVIAPQLLSIAISPTSLELTSGTSSRLTVTARFNDGTTQDVTAITDWTSNDATIASVNTTELANSGRVKGVSDGSATITATYGGFSDTLVVKVRTRIFRDLTISGTSTAVAGNQVTFTATASYSDGTSKDVTEDTAWSIDKTNVATLADAQNQPGQVVMVDSGSATLTASFGGKTKTVTLTSRLP